MIDYNTIVINNNIIAKDKAGNIIGTFKDARRKDIFKNEDNDSCTYNIKIGNFIPAGECEVEEKYLCIEVEDTIKEENELILICSSVKKLNFKKLHKKKRKI